MQPIQAKSNIAQWTLLRHKSVIALTLLSLLGRVYQGKEARSRWIYSIPLSYTAMCICVSVLNQTVDWAIHESLLTKTKLGR